MKINCISCGHKIDLGDDYDDYEGPIKCFVCEGLLEIRTKDGNVKSVGNFAVPLHPLEANGESPVR